MQRVKVYGADLIRFFEEWPPGPDWAISDAEVAVVDGSLRWVGLLPAEAYPNAPHVQPTEEYTLTHGYLWWQNQQQISPLGVDPIFVDVLHRWKHAKEFIALAVAVPREQVEKISPWCSFKLGFAGTTDGDSVMHLLAGLKEGFVLNVNDLDVVFGSIEQDAASEEMMLVGWTFEESVEDNRGSSVRIPLDGASVVVY